MLFYLPFCKEDVFRPSVLTLSAELVVRDILPPLPASFVLALTPLPASATADVLALAVSVVSEGGAAEECTLPEVTMPRLAVEVVSDVFPVAKDELFLPRDPGLAVEGERPKTLGPDSLRTPTVGNVPLGWASGMCRRTKTFDVREAVFLGINVEFSDIFKLKFMSSTCGSTCKNVQFLSFIYLV